MGVHDNAGWVFMMGQNMHQALNAIVFLYKKVLDLPVAENIGYARAKQQLRSPVVLTKHEIQQVFATMKGDHLLMAKILYGCGLRLMECIRLRIQALYFGQNLVYIRDSKGGKDRVVALPQSVREDLLCRVEAVKKIYNEELL